MKQLFLTLIVTLFTFGVVVPEAEAKRLGGGSSFGMKRQATPPAAAPQQNMTRPQNAAPAAGVAAQPKRSWMGPIAGLAAGLGLAALFSHLGMGEELASFMMIALLVVGAVILFKLLFRRGNAQTAPRGMQYAGAAAGSGNIAGAGAGAAPDFAAPASSSGAKTPASVSAAVASGFDAEGFARQAKLNFIRLQAANDARNLDDIREFTTPEVYAEISMQIGERGTAPQRTDVVELNAEVFDVVEEADRYIVSVHFNGLLREEDGAAPAPFDETWHLTKPLSGDAGWRIAGIQQN
ncbi:MAG: transporter [Betaproteobacteria bacterium HGW-Betaproteobacteria-21]|nr:MAG: transporter [Betaproteobacteria bacterium HGW-Betaproteobacteria-21]